MARTFRIRTIFAAFAGNRSAVKLEGSPATVRDATRRTLGVSIPVCAIASWTSKAKFASTSTYLSVAMRSAFTDGLATPVPDGSEILIVPGSQWRVRQPGC